MKINIDTTGDRLRKIRQIKGLSAEDLSKLIDVPVSSIYNWEKRNSAMPASIALKIADKLNISMVWLINGIGTMEQIDCEFTERQIPIVAEIHAGHPTEAYDEILGYEIIPATHANRRINAAIRVLGDSMEPRLHEGDLVFVGSPPPIADIPS